MTLKERIKELADEQQISLPALESKLGFGNGTIVKWDKTTPNADKLNVVAKYFNVTMDYLLNGETPTKIHNRETKEASRKVEYPNDLLRYEDVFSELQENIDRAYEAISMMFEFFGLNKLDGAQCYNVKSLHVCLSIVCDYVFLVREQIGKEVELWENRE